MNLETALGIIMFVVLTVGAVQCFLGYRLIKPVLAVFGFLIGAAIPGLITYYLLSLEGSTVIISGLVGGLFGALLAVLMHYVAIFMMGFTLGTILGYLLASVFGLVGESPMSIMMAILGLAGAILSIIYRRWVIIAATSFIGSFSFIIGISYFLGGVTAEKVSNLPPFYANPGLLLALGLGAAGVYIQHKYTAELNFKQLTAKTVDSAK